MIKKTMTCTDFNGVEYTEDYYFNLSKAELAEMQIAGGEDFSVTLNRMIDAKDHMGLMLFFKELIARSVGKKSEDGRRFIKNEDIRDDFMQSDAYSELFMSIASDEGAAQAFVAGILPKMPTNA